MSPAREGFSGLTCSPSSQPAPRCSLWRWPALNAEKPTLFCFLAGQTKPSWPTSLWRRWSFSNRLHQLLPGLCKHSAALYQKDTWGKYQRKWDALHLARQAGGELLSSSEDFSFFPGLAVEVHVFWTDFYNFLPESSIRIKRRGCRVGKGWTRHVALQFLTRGWGLCQLIDTPLVVCSFGRGRHDKFRRDFFQSFTLVRWVDCNLSVDTETPQLHIMRCIMHWLTRPENENSPGLWASLAFSWNISTLIGPIHPFLYRTTLFLFVYGTSLHLQQHVTVIPMPATVHLAADVFFPFVAGPQERKTDGACPPAGNLIMAPLIKHHSLRTSINSLSTSSGSLIKLRTE